MSNIEILDDIFNNKITPAFERFKAAAMRANRICPECNGTNLNSTQTKCWDCSSADNTEADSFVEKVPNRKEEN